MMGKALKYLTIICGLFVFLDIYFALIGSPPEQQMHDLVRIMYFHVSSAWIAFFSFFVTFACSVAYLFRRKLVFDIYAQSSAEIGVLFTSITLITGSLWARPIWNTWWTWDPRLTTTLILWFLYIGYLLLRGTISGAEQRARVTAIYAIIAFVDVPIIHMSVTWWRSIHPNVINETGFNMSPPMIFTLLFSFVTFMLLYLLLVLLRARQEQQRYQLQRLHRGLLELRAKKSGV